MSRFDPFDASTCITAALCALCGEYICNCNDHTRAEAHHSHIQNLGALVDIDEAGINSDPDLYDNEGDWLYSLYQVAEPLATRAINLPARDWTVIDRLAMDIAYNAGRLLLDTHGDDWQLQNQPNYYAYDDRGYGRIEDEDDALRRAYEDAMNDEIHRGNYDSIPF
jgi:hypothetical protein